MKNFTDPLRSAARANLSAPLALHALPAPSAPALPPAVGWHNTVRDITRNLVISGALPLLIYFVVTSRGASTFVALAVAAIPPALDGLYGMVRRRRIDLIAALVLAGIVGQHRRGAAGRQPPRAVGARVLSHWRSGCGMLRVVGAPSPAPHVLLRSLLRHQR